MEIHPALELEPPLTILPWDPVSASMYKVKHNLTGGEAPFSWSSSLPSLAATSQLGVSEVQGEIMGSSQVSVAMTRAPHCKAEAEVNKLSGFHLQCRFYTAVSFTKYSS